ncbi:MAG: purine-nucleoside phosphorylase [Anaerolinea sp.]
MTIANVIMQPQAEAAHYTEAAHYIQTRTMVRPRVGIVLGSGMGGLADLIEDAFLIPYEDIPGWPQSTVHGHAGRLVIGKLEGQTVICQQGRAHFYEGYSLQQVTLPIRVMGLLGVEAILLTNAGGGLNPAYRVGDIMMLNDHIYLAGLCGANPLMGPNDDALGPRFPGMSRTYDRDLRQAARAVAAAHDIPLHEGVYVCVSGPFFESPAEVRFLRMIGGDTVGMSTVHEVVVARHMGLRVAAFSGVTNEAITHIDGDADANHEEVLEAGKLIVPRMTALLRGVIRAV